MVKYVTDDGEVFETETAAHDHERIMAKRIELKAQVEKYVGMLDYANDRARARAATQIMGWIDYDLRQRPDRYEYEFPAVEPPVAIAT